MQTEPERSRQDRFAALAAQIGIAIAEDGNPERALSHFIEGVNNLEPHEQLIVLEYFKLGRASAAVDATPKGSTSEPSSPHALTASETMQESMTPPAPTKKEAKYLGHIQRAVKAVPALRYLWGVIGIAATAAAIAGWVTPKAFLLIVAAMVVIAVFSVVTAENFAKHLRLPALVLLWCVVILGVLFACLTFIQDFPIIREWMRT